MVGYAEETNYLINDYLKYEVVKGVNKKLNTDYEYVYNEMSRCGIQRPVETNIGDEKWVGVKGGFCQGISAYYLTLRLTLINYIKALQTYNNIYSK